MKSIPLALLRTLQPVKIQEQLLEWDVSGHTSFENKTVATVWLYDCLRDFIYNTFVQFPDTRHAIKAIFGKVSIVFLQYGKYNNMFEFGSIRVHV